MHFYQIISIYRTKEAIDTSLEYLGLDYVDILQIHDIEFADNVDIVVNETLPAVEEARAQGKAKFIGVTGYALSVLKEAIVKAPGRFDVSLCNNNQVETSTKLPNRNLQNLNIMLDVCLY